MDSDGLPIVGPGIDYRKVCNGMNNSCGYIIAHVSHVQLLSNSSGHIIT